MEEFLSTWATSRDATTMDGEDVEMDDIEAISNEAQLAKLRKCVDAFVPRIEGNAWLQAVLSST